MALSDGRAPVARFLQNVGDFALVADRGEPLEQRERRGRIAGRGVELHDAGVAAVDAVLDLEQISDGHGDDGKAAEAGGEDHPAGVAVRMAGAQADGRERAADEERASPKLWSRTSKSSRKA